MSSTAEVEGPTPCQHHPDEIAGWVCLACRHNLCPSCVAQRPADNNADLIVCITCGSTVETLVVSRAKGQPFWRRMLSFRGAPGDDLQPLLPDAVPAGRLGATAGMDDFILGHDHAASRAQPGEMRSIAITLEGSPDESIRLMNLSTQMPIKPSTAAQATLGTGPAPLPGQGQETRGLPQTVGTAPANMPSMLHLPGASKHPNAGVNATPAPIPDEPIKAYDPLAPDPQHAIARSLPDSAFYPPKEADHDVVLGGESGIEMADVKTGPVFTGPAAALHEALHARRMDLAITLYLAHPDGMTPHLSADQCFIVAAGLAQARHIGPAISLLKRISNSSDVRVAPRGLFLLARLYSDARKDFDQAEAAFRKLILKYPDSREAGGAKAYLHKLGYKA